MSKRIIIVVLLGCAVMLCAGRERRGTPWHDFPPQKPAVMPAFEIPATGGRLDDEWTYAQTLRDADSTRPDLYNAYPTGLSFTYGGRGAVSMLHTIFTTADGGRTWRNLDPYPPPSISASAFTTLRAPTYLSAMASRPAPTSDPNSDVFLMTTTNSGDEHGTVRMVYHFFTYRLESESLMTAPMWLTGISFADSARILVFAGLDGTIFRNDSFSIFFPSGWPPLDPDKVLLRTGRDDTLDLNDTWVSGAASVGKMVMAVGSHHWQSRDDGERWQIVPAADSIYDEHVHFCDTLRGLVGAGTLRPEPHGWLRRTTDGGHTWSERLLDVNLPIRAVHMATPEIGFAAGGNFSQAQGKIWKTTDGGLNWFENLDADAEILQLTSFRFNATYIDVVAAGVFPDFRAGIWRSRLFVPDSSGSMLVAAPDTLDFGVVPPGARDTLTAVIRNNGLRGDTIMSLSGYSPIFQPLGTWSGIQLAPGDSAILPVVFAPVQHGRFTVTLTISGLHDVVEVYCAGQTTPFAIGPDHAALPEQASLRVFPNPGNARFQIRFQLSAQSKIALSVYDLSGRLVERLASGEYSPGEHVTTWNAAERASGLYFLRLDGSTFSQTAKVLLVK